MKKLLSVSLLVAASAMAASWTGWISDAKCGAKGNSAAHAACAKNCIKAGEKPVLVTDDGKVYQIANPDKVTAMAGERVTAKGSESGDTVTVDSIKKTKS